MKDDTEEIILNSLDKYTKILYEGKFSLTLADENDLEFIINDNYGEIVSDKREICMEFLATREIMGFEEIDRGCYGRTVYKLNKEIKGDWLRLVTYKDWILRAIDQDNDKFLLLCNSLDAKNIGFKQVKNFKIMYKWVPKSEVIIEKTWGE